MVKPSSLWQFLFLMKKFVPVFISGHLSLMVWWHCNLPNEERPREPRGCKPWWAHFNGARAEAPSRQSKALGKIRNQTKAMARAADEQSSPSLSPYLDCSSYCHCGNLSNLVSKRWQTPLHLACLVWTAYGPLQNWFAPMPYESVAYEYCSVP